MTELESRILSMIHSPKRIQDIVEAFPEYMAVDVKLAALRAVEAGRARLTSSWEIVSTADAATDNHSSEVQP